MTATAPTPDDLRQEAARIAAAVLRLDEPAAYPPRSHTPPGPIEEYHFLPSWRAVPRNEIEGFLVALSSPALLAPTTIRGTIALLLLHELSGDRRRWAEKTLSNFAEALRETATSLALSPSSRVLLEFDGESHLFSFGAVHEWSQQFPVQVGWTVWRLEGDDRADARLMVRRSDGRPYPGRSYLGPPRPQSVP